MGEAMATKKKKKQELSHVNLVRELQDIPEDRKNYLRMNKGTYLDLLERVTLLVKKQDAAMRSAITPHERLAPISIITKVSTVSS